MRNELLESLADVNDLYDVLAEEYPALPTHRLLDAAISIAKANAIHEGLAEINKTIEHGLVVAPSVPSGLAEMAKALGFDS